MGRKEKRAAEKAKRQPAAPPEKSAVPQIVYAIIAAFAVLLYWNTFHHDYALDDDVITRANKYVQSGFEGIPMIFKKGFYHGFNGVNEGSYRPMVLLNMAIEKELFGNDPHYGHVFNVLFYALAALVLFSLLRNMFREQGWQLPLVITLLFTAHPIHTEVVANIKSRDEILCFLFIAGSLNLLLLHAGKKRLVLLAASLLLYMLSLLTKEYGITVIAVIPCMLWIFTKEKAASIVKYTVLFGAVAGLYFVIRASILDNLAFKEEMDLINNSLVGATSYADRLATAFVILGKYLVLLVFPHPLSFDYSYNQIPIVSWGNVKPIISLLFYLALGALAFMGIRKRKPLAFGIVFFIFTLSVVSNLLIEIGATLAERFLFTPSVGFCMALVLLLAKMMKYDALPGRKNTLFYGIITVALVGYSMKTYSRNKDWKNNITLFTADVIACPNSARTHFSLASALNNDSGSERDAQKRAAMLQRAIAGFKKCLEIYPEFSAAWYNMGVAYFSLGKEDEAKLSYENAIRINPNDKQALNNLGVVYFNNKEYNKALGYFQAAVKANPSFVDSYANIGAVYHNLGDYENAITFYHKAIELDPQNKGAMRNLVKAYRSIGEEEKANYYSALAQ